LTTLFVLCSCFAAAAPPATLALRVHDPQGGAVVGARAALHSRSGQAVAGAVTDGNGACRFADLAAGEYVLAVEAAGFSRAEPRRVRLEPGASANVMVELSLAGLHEQVVVTAAGAPQTVDEVSKAVTVVDRSEIEARGEVAVADVLRSSAGVRVQQLGGPGSATSIRVRGLRAEDTAVLLDGVRFRDPTGTQGDASTFLQDLLVTDIDRVEVLRGSGSSLYGSHAIGGVVNILSAEGAGALKGSVLLEGGSLGLLHERGAVEGGLAADRLTYSLGFARMDVFDGLDGNDRADNTSMQGLGRFRVSPNATVLARVYGADASAYLNETPRTVGALPPGVLMAVPLFPEELQRYEAGTAVSQLRLDGANFIPSVNDPDNRRQSRFRSALFRFEQRPTPSLGYSVSYHRLSTDRAFLDGPRGVSAFEPRVATRSDYVGTVHTLATRVDLSLGRHQLVTAGWEFESETFENGSFPGDGSANSSVDVTQKSHSLFLQDQVRLLGGRLQVAGSLRAQLFTLDAPRFEPPASVPYQGVRFDAPPSARTADGSIAYSLPSLGTGLRAHVGSGYRAPSLFERFGTGFDSSFGYSVFGDPRLGPERSLGIDAGVDQSLLGARLRASATYFRTRLRDVILFDFSGTIHPDTDPFGRSAGYRSAGSGQASGLELSVSATPFASGRISAAYTFVDAQPPTGVRDATRALGVPRHQLSLVALAGLDRDLTASFALVAMSEVQSRIGTRILRFDVLAKADAQASYRPPFGSKRRVRLFARVENLLDRTYFENGFRTPGRTAAIGATLAF
jgi:iron complex outermembrane receptor protein